MRRLGVLLPILLALSACPAEDLPSVVKRIRKTVPTVTEMSEKDARNVLQEAGFKVETRAPECPDEGSGARKVTEQNPAGGTPAPQGSTVTLFVECLPGPGYYPDLAPVDEGY